MHYLPLLLIFFISSCGSIKHEQENIHLKIKDKSQEVLGCATEYKVLNGERTTIEVALLIKADGKLEQFTLKNISLYPEGFSECLNRIFSKIKFNPRENPSPIEAHQPFIFLQRK